MSATLRTAQFLTAYGCLVMSALDAQQPTFVPGQFVTRFAEGTPQRGVVEQVSQTIPLDLTGLDNVTEELSQRAGVPLRVYHLGSGYWLTFEVDREALPGHVRSTLASQAGVLNIEFSQAPGRDSLRQYTVTAADGSALARMVNRRDDRAVNELLESWSMHVGLHLQSAFEDGRLVLTVDWNASTLELVERIDTLPEIEAAQPNYRMGFGSPS